MAKVVDVTRSKSIGNPHGGQTVGTVHRLPDVPGFSVRYHSDSMRVPRIWPLVLPHNTETHTEDRLKY